MRDMHEQKAHGQAVVNLVETKYDHWLPPLAGDNRRDPVIKAGDGWDGSLQSLDWNGGLEWWNCNSAKMRSKGHNVGGQLWDSS